MGNIIMLMHLVTVHLAMLAKQFIQIGSSLSLVNASILNSFLSLFKIIFELALSRR